MTINIDGNEIKFGFGLYFIGKAQSFFDTDLKGLLTRTKNNMDVAELMYISAKSEAFLDEKPFSYSIRDWISLFETDKVGNEVLTDWQTVFIDSIKGHFLPEDNTTDIEVVDEEEVTVKKK